MKKIFICVAAALFSFACEIATSSDDSVVNVRLVKQTSSIDLDETPRRGNRAYLVRVNVGNSSALSGKVRVSNLQTTYQTAEDEVFLPGVSASAAKSAFSAPAAQSALKAQALGSGANLNLSSSVLKSESLAASAPSEVFIFDDAKARHSVAERQSFTDDTGCSVRLLVADDAWSDSTGEDVEPGKVTQADVDDLAVAFKVMLPTVRGIIGQEGGISDVSAFLSDDIHIVISDINQDAYEGQTVGVYGFFNSDDFFLVEKDMSNRGKYIYIDSHFLHNIKPRAILEAAHDFAHLCAFYRTCFSGDAKHGKKDGNYSVPPWWTEMIATNCEDAVYNALQNAGIEIPKSDLPSERLSSHVFSSEYAVPPLAWTQIDETTYDTCATNYLFGAYLIRNYGYAAFQRIAQSGEWGVKSIQDNVGENVSIGDILCGFPEALIFTKMDSKYNISVGKKTLNKQIDDGLLSFFPIGAGEIPVGRRTRGDAKNFEPYDFDIVYLGITKDGKDANGNQIRPEITVESTDAAINYEIVFIDDKNLPVKQPAIFNKWVIAK